MLPLCTQLDAIMPLVSAGLLPLPVATPPPSLQQINQPKTVLDLELEMGLSFPVTPVGKDSFLSFLAVTDVSEPGFQQLNFSNRSRPGAQEVGARGE